mmetsp:Transcript_3734/g.9379  ORF Transcript_3734/g.9379 Transcript_3734/m.9379 type:complete len:409 (-) Transcript_3734:853-2079(-)
MVGFHFGQGGEQFLGVRFRHVNHFLLAVQKVLTKLLDRHHVGGRSKNVVPYLVGNAAVVFIVVGFLLANHGGFGANFIFEPLHQCQDLFVGKTFHLFAFSLFGHGRRHGPHAQSKKLSFRIVEHGRDFLEVIVKFFLHVRDLQIDAREQDLEFSQPNPPVAIQINVVPDIAQQERFVGDPHFGRMVRGPHLSQTIDQGLSVLGFGHEHVERLLLFVQNGDDAFHLIVNARTAAIAIAATAATTGNGRIFASGQFEAGAADHSHVPSAQIGHVNVSHVLVANADLVFGGSPYKVSTKTVLKGTEWNVGDFVGHGGHDSVSSLLLSLLLSLFLSTTTTATLVTRMRSGTLTQLLLLLLSLMLSLSSKGLMRDKEGAVILRHGEGTGFQGSAGGDLFARNAVFQSIQRLVG